jgi:hypothetical protein
MTNPTYRKKLIEVTLPLVSINDASATEKGNPFLKGHPRNLHQWWARRPLATCRAIRSAIFATSLLLSALCSLCFELSAMSCLLYAPCPMRYACPVKFTLVTAQRISLG